MPVFEPSTIVLATLLGSLVLFLSDSLRYDLVALLVVLVLVTSRCLSPEEAFAGFASEPVIVIACLCLFGYALSRWGVGEALCARFLSRKDLGEGALVLRITLISAMLASVMSDVAVVGILIPMIATIARRRGLSMSRLLMPVSFGAFLGDLLMVIGSAKNLAVNGVLAQHEAQTFAMFDFTHYGLITLAVGAVYLAGPGRRLLPRTRVAETLSEHYRVPRFVTEVLVEPSSTLINRSVADVDLFQQAGVGVLGIVRAGGEGTTLAPGPYNRIRRDDTLVLQGDPESILRVRSELGLRERASAGEGERRLDSSDVQLVEAVVPAGSSLGGRTLSEADFRARTGLNVLALSKNGEVQATRVPHTKLEVGDTLLIQGHLRDLERARRERDVVVLSEVQAPLIGRGAWISVGLLVSLLGVSLLKLLPLHVAALAGAIGLVVTGCVPVKDVYKEIDWLVIVLIGGMLALGRAFEKHHMAEMLAEQIAGLGRAFANPHVVLALVLVAATLLAQTTTAVATAVILTPVALSLAHELQVSDRAFVMAVLTGTNCAFMSPVSHPANAMVVGPGDYRYRDFLRVGAPLTGIIVVIALVLLPWFWPFHPAG